MDEKYDYSAEIIDEIYCVIGGEDPPRNAMPEINLTCARVAALRGNWDLALSMAILANEQLESDRSRYPIEDGKYLRYFAKNVIEYCEKCAERNDFLDTSKSINLMFDEIRQDEVRGNTKVIFKIYRVDSDK